MSAWPQHHRHRSLLKDPLLPRLPWYDQRQAHYNVLLGTRARTKSGPVVVGVRAFPRRGLGVVVGAIGWLVEVSKELIFQGQASVYLGIVGSLRGLFHLLRILRTLPGRFVGASARLELPLCHP